MISFLFPRYRKRQVPMILIFCYTALSIGQNSSEKNKVSDFSKTKVTQFSKSSLKNYMERKSIEDSLFNETKTHQIPGKWELNKAADNDRQIHIQRADKAENELIIQQQKTRLFGWLVFAIALSCSGYLFYNQQQSRHKQFQKEGALKDALRKIENQNKLQEQRLRISSDFYDMIGAQLAFIISSIDNLKYGLDITDHKFNEKLSSISDFASECIYELRDSMWAMHKSEITFEDLQSRLLNYVDKVDLFDDKVNFSFHVDSNVNVMRSFNMIQGLDIHRIIQEAIKNSLKHANATSINVNVEEFQEQIKFTSSDDGQGFNIHTVDKRNGLSNMQKRAKNINANLQIISNLSEGTKVVISI